MDTTKTNILAFKNKTIHIVEDDTDYREILQLKFEERGFTVFTSADGCACLSDLKEQEPNLIVMDLTLPKKTGIELLQEIKHDKQLRHIPVVILSSHSDMDKIAAAISRGALSYIVKSDHIPSEVVDIVSKHIETPTLITHTMSVST